MHIELRHMRHFLVVAEELHFRRAAERLNIAQPALSRSIQHLELALGVKLFERSKRNVRITAAGRKYTEGCKSVLAAAEAAADNARLVHSGRLGLLRIGYTDFAISARLPGLLTGFQQECPGVILKPVHGVTNIQLEHLAGGALDVGFVTGPINMAGTETRLIQEEEFVCVVYEDHPLATRQIVELAELADEDFVHGPIKDWEYFYYQLFPLCRRAGFMPRIVQEVYNSAAILGLVAGRMGITILTESTGASPIPGLVKIPIARLDERLQTYAIWRRKAMNGVTQRFVSFLERAG